MTLQLNLQAPKKPFLAEGAMPFVLTLRNTGTNATQVSASSGPSPFEYRVVPEDGSGPVQTASARQKQMAGSPGLLPRPVSSMETLPPDKVVIFRENLAALLSQPLNPGRYRLEAAYRMPGNVLLHSAGVPVEVVISNPVAIAQTLDDARANLVTVEFHLDDDGQILVRKREGAASGLPAAQFYPMRTLPSPAGLKEPSVALEIENGNPRHWRWVAWLDGNSLFAGVARAIDAKYPKGPVDTGLDSASLLPFGYGYPDGRGEFVLTGVAQGRRTIRLCTLPAGDTAVPQFRDVQMANPPGGAPQATLRLRADGKQDLALSWIPRTQGPSECVQSLVDPTTGAVTSPPSSVFIADRALAASSFPAILRDGSPEAYRFLLAPKDPSGRFTLVQVQIGDTAKPVEQDLPATDSFEEPVDRWILPSHATPHARIAAISGNKLWILGLAGSWQDLDAEHISPPSVRLWALSSGQFWCTWFDSLRGYVYHKVG